MTEQRSALDNALDLLLYAPVGLALTAAEELPKLAAKGRTQVQGQVTIARMVGQFAVTQGRKEIEKRLGISKPPAQASKPSGAQRKPAAHSPLNGKSSTAAASENGSYERLSGRTAARGSDARATAAAPAREAAVIDVDFGTSSRAEGPVGAAPVQDKPAPPEPTVVATGPSQSPESATGSTPSAQGLAIPGYDSLSASQVVQRLAGLSQEELAAVGEYEAAHRGRRTILTRVGQLKG
ncbi:MAG TPA: hypothetical protein VFH56_10070 [Acidimicrobiales bacterium]|nr:hypothetical protein [Acidimicrobiales bacterium]